MDELSNTADALKTLEEYRNTAGHKALVDIAHQQMGVYMNRFMYEQDADLVQLRADFRAWMDIVAAVDKRIGDYSAYIAQIMEQNNRQAQQAQGGANGRF